MASKGHVIAIASETGAFEKGLKLGVIKPTEQAQQALEELASSRAGDKLGTQLENAQRDTRDLARETKRTAATIETEYRDSYRKASKASQDFTTDAGENVKGFKDEAVQNLSEVASSFTGDLQQAADGIQGITGGLAASLTPGIGIPVAIIGAAAGAFLAAWQQNTEATKQLVSDMYDDMVQSGDAFLSADFIQQGIAKVYRDNIDQVKARSAELGADSRSVAEAMAGDITSVTQLLDAQNAKRDEEIARIRSSGDALDVQRNRIDGVNAKYAAQNGWLVEIARGHDTAATKAQAAQAATDDYLKRLISGTGDAALEVDDLGNKLVTLPDGKQVLIDVMTGKATTDLSKFKGDADGIIDHLNGRQIVPTVVTGPMTEQLRRALAPFQTLTVTPKVGPLKDGYKWQ